MMLPVAASEQLPSAGGELLVRCEPGEEADTVLEAPTDLGLISEGSPCVDDM